MRCKHCGNKNRPGTRYCAVCGKPLGEEPPGRKPWRGVLAVVGSVLVVAVICCVVMYSCEQKHVQEILPGKTGENAGSNASDSINPMDYYLAHSKLVSQTNLSESSNVQTEQEVSQSYAERGFAGSEVSSSYAADGSYLSEGDVADGERTKHPLYDGLYESAAGDTWKIYAADGEFMAYPVDIQSFVPTMQFVVSESEHIVSYDNASNAFYRIVPESDLLAVIKVERLDAATLDSFAKGGAQ